MSSSFGALEQMSYPGRLILIGRTNTAIVVAYGVTARSAASKAKRYVLAPDQSRIEVQATDQEVMAEGNLDLLQYTSFYFSDSCLVVGNGKQTDAIQAAPKQGAPRSILETSLTNWTDEQDAYRTPRISGLVMKQEGVYEAALHRIRASTTGEVCHETYPIFWEVGKGKLITTYAGPNVRPTPSSEGLTLDVDLSYQNAKECAEALFQVLGPEAGEDDLRVSVMCVFQDLKTEKREIEILNTIF